MKIYFDFQQLPAIFLYMQIPKAKYKQGLKLYQSMRLSAHLPQINSELKRIGFSHKELDSFWNSSFELRAFKYIYDEEQLRLTEEQDAGYSDEVCRDPLASYADNYEIQFDIQ
jgi:hypothetical protein